MRGLWLVALLGAAPVCAAEEFSFDVGAYEKTPWEFGGHLEVGLEHLRLDPDAALANLNYPAGVPDTDHRYRARLELSGLYRWDRLTLRGLWQAETLDERSRSRHGARFHELYLTAEPGGRWTLAAGKRALRWGKGYAFSPVGFIERPKDATDPELSREGFVVATAEYVRSFDGPLQTFSFTPVILPVDGSLNDDFGMEEDINLAARFYFLYRDTDIDLLLRHGDSRPDAIGIDFSRNLATHFEVHGEVAWFDDRRHRVLDDSNLLVTRETQAFDWLLGLRYLTEAETTWIIEYYHNGAGYTRDEMRSFYALARTTALANSALAARQAGYGVAQPMRDYLYVKMSRKEPFDALYWNAGVTVIANLHDGSASILPEVIYSGITDLELRGRLALLTGGRDTDFGERPNDWRAELRLRYFF